MAKTDFQTGTVVTAEFLNAIFEHVHDGADEDGSAPKVDLADHIDWGDNGQMEVTDDGNDPRTEYTSENGDAALAADILEGMARLVSDVIRPESADTVTLETADGGSDSYLDLLTAILESVRARDHSSGDDYDRVEVLNANGSHGWADAANTPKAQVTIDIDSSGESASIQYEEGIDSVSYESPGEYTLTTGKGINQQSMVVQVTAEDSSSTPGPATPVIERFGSDEIRIHVWDNDGERHDPDYLHVTLRWDDDAADTNGEKPYTGSADV